MTSYGQGASRKVEPANGCGISPAKCSVAMPGPGYSLADSNARIYPTKSVPARTSMRPIAAQYIGGGGPYGSVDAAIPRSVPAARPPKIPTATAPPSPACADVKATNGMDAVIKSALVVLRKFVSPQSNLLDPEASTLHRRDVNKDVLPPPFLAVHFRMLSRGLVLVLGGLQVVTECNPGVMRRLLVVARLMMLAGLTMVFGSVFIVLRRLFVVLVNS